MHDGAEQLGNLSVQLLADGLMRFSQRTGWNTEESELARAHRLRAQAGLPIADLTASNPTRCGFQYAPELLAGADRSEGPRLRSAAPGQSDRPPGGLRTTMPDTALRSIPARSC